MAWLVETGREAIGLNFPPHWHVERHLALGHELSPVDIQTANFSQIDPFTGFVGAVAVNHLAARANHITQAGSRRKDQRKYDKGSGMLHRASISQKPQLPKWQDGTPTEI